MQTIYYSTASFVRHTDNVVDLGEYRRKLALAQEGSLAPQPQAEAFCWEEDWEDAPCQPTPDEIHQANPRPRGHQRQERRALVLDLCASAGVVVMTLTFTLRLLLG